MRSRALAALFSGVIAISMAAHAAAADALDARVSIAFVDAKAADVLGALASAAGVKVEIGTGAMRPVTITVTNVKLITALNAVCENAFCSWRFDGALRVTPLPSEASALLPPRVSFALWDVPPADVFRALAAAIGVAIAIEPKLPNDPVSLNFKNAPTPEVLNTLCTMMQCDWDFDPQRGIRVTTER